MNRREVLRCAAAGVLTAWVPRRVVAQQPADGFVRLTQDVAVVDGGGSNVVALSTARGLVVVDSGAPKSGDAVMAALRRVNLAANGFKVRALFNTHYHLDQTGNNEMFAAVGATIITHERTRQWLSTDYWVPGEDRYEKARPKAAWPTETFQTSGSLKESQVEYGYLTLAHTSGDIYVFFKDSNVLAVGDVASPLRDPALDYFTGAWIGGRVDSMDVILGLANEQTKIVPAYGPVMTKAQFKAERDVMEEVRARMWKQVREGDGPQDMLEGGVMKGLAREWKDPSKFLYDACKGLWAHHNKLDANVV